MAELEEALQTRLAAFAGLSALVAARIYAVRAPQNPTLPYVTYQRIAAERFSAMGSDTGVASVLMQLDAWSEASALQAKQVATQVRLALERWRSEASDPVVLDVFIERNEDIDPLEEDIEEDRKSVV